MTDPEQPQDGKARADQPTIVSDLGKQAAESAQDATRATQPMAGARTPSGLLDTQATLVQGASGPPKTGKTIVTHLHVDGDGPGGSADGTHRGQVWGDFKLGELLGRGGMGAVYKGLQVSLDRPVAVKVLPENLSANENFRSRFQLEAKAVAKLSSPNVIQVYGAGVHEGHHYFAMEYVEGEDLSRRLRSGLKPTFADTLNFVTQAARGLAAAGELGIVHRDIKPANMMITGKGVLKLMDFGLVKLASEDHSLTMSGTIMGTVTYFSPEQGRGDRCDQRTDIYALGVVFYELLTGKLPFSGGDATSIIYQHIHASPKPPKEIDATIPDDFQAVVLKCMQKRVEDRYQTAAELLSDLARLEKGLQPAIALQDPQALRQGATVMRSPPFSQENRLRRTWIVLAAFAVAVVATIFLANRTKPPMASPPAVTPTGIPTVVTSTAPSIPLVIRPTSRVKIDDVRALVKAGRLDEAKRSTDAALSADPGDADWTKLSAEIDADRGAILLKTAQDAFASGDIETAGGSAAAASALLHDSPELTKLLAQLKEREGARVQRDRAVKEAENLLAAGEFAKAEDMLTPLAAQTPGDQGIDGALGRARAMRENAETIEKAVREQLTNANDALERKDYDGALLAFTAAKSFDHKNAPASDGLNRVNAIKQKISEMRNAFDQALTAKDLDAANARLAELRAIAPGSATLVVAENQLVASRLAEDQKRRQDEEHEAKVSGEAKRLLDRIDDQGQDLSTLERDVAAFIAKAGGERPERALLDRRLEDRHQRAQVAKDLSALDASVVAKDAGAIAKSVADADFAQALVKLGTYKGLEFASTLIDFIRQEDKATAKVRIHHALAVFPARDLVYLYDLHRDDTGWRIVAAHLQSP